MTTLIIRRRPYISDHRARAFHARVPSAPVRRRPRQRNLFTDNVRCPIHVSDLAAALLELAEGGTAGGQHAASRCRQPP